MSAPALSLHEGSAKEFRVYLTALSKFSAVDGCPVDHETILWDSSLAKEFCVWVPFTKQEE